MLKFARILKGAFVLAVLGAGAPALAEGNCATVTALSKYELIEVAHAAKIHICPGAKFSKYELIEILNAGASLTIRTADTQLTKYEMIEVAKAGTVSLYVNSAKYSKYELIEIIQSGASVVLLNDSFYSKYELIEILRAGARLGD